MNPLTLLDEEGHTIIQLTEEDRALMKETHLEKGALPIEDQVMHRMCVMQMVHMLSLPPEARLTPQDVEAYQYGTYEQRRDLEDRAYVDTPPCVSLVVADAMVCLNDLSSITPQQRGRLKSLVEGVMNTCPIRRVYENDRVVDYRDETEGYEEVEDKRREILRPLLLDEGDEPEVTFAQGLALVRKAAAVYRVTATTTQPQEGGPK